MTTVGDGLKQIQVIQLPMYNPPNGHFDFLSLQTENLPVSSKTTKMLKGFGSNLVYP